MYDEYGEIYGYGIKDDAKLEKIEEFKDTIGRGDCLYCGAKLAMEYSGNICFICSTCGKSVHEDVYYSWAAGYDISLE